MNIFFTASIHGSEELENNYKLLANSAEKRGHTINTNYVLQSNSFSDNPAEDYKNILNDIKKSDTLFAEATYPSLSVGYFISFAIQINKPVVIFYAGTREKEPHLFAALESMSDKLQIIRYSKVEQIEKEMNFILDFVSSSQDTRFNFFVTPELSSYLNWISKNKKIPRSVYLRDLIEEEMTKYRDFEN